MHVEQSNKWSENRGEQKMERKGEEQKKRTKKEKKKKEVMDKTDWRNRCMKMVGQAADTCGPVAFITSGAGLQPNPASSSVCTSSSTAVT